MGGYYLLDIVAAPMELQMTILIVPIAMDVLHWTLMNKAIRNVNQNRENDNVIKFGNKLKYFSHLSWGTALLCQCSAFGLVAFNPFNSMMIDSLSIYGTALVGLSPLTPMIFTLIHHETVFAKMRTKIGIK